MVENDPTVHIDLPKRHVRGYPVIITAYLLASLMKHPATTGMGLKLTSMVS